MKYDVEIIAGTGGAVIDCDVDDRDTSSDLQIRAGEPVKVSGNFVVHIADGEPRGNAVMLGIAVNDSTETASVDGKVKVQLVIPGKTILRCKATTTANFNTAALLQGLMFDAITFDRTGSTEYTYKIDEDEGSDKSGVDSHGLEVVGGSITDGYLDVIVLSWATEVGQSIIV